MRHFIVIPRLKIHNANAMSSPYTIGFPAMTAWLGAVHALQRKLNQTDFPELKFINTGVSCHAFDLQTYKGRGDYVHSIIGTSNPLGKDGGRPAFIEEARCHLTVSLILEYKGVMSDEVKDLIMAMTDLLHGQMKMASGDILGVDTLHQQTINEEDASTTQALMRQLMLGYVIVERRDLMIEAMRNGNDALDALLNHLKVTHRATQDKQDNVTWSSSRLTHGWIVPIAVGFQGISELGLATNQRDANTPHRFAESVVTLGEFVMPYRIKKIDDMLWQYHVDLKSNLYLCQSRHSHFIETHV